MIDTVLQGAIVAWIRAGMALPSTFPVVRANQAGPDLAAGGVITFQVIGNIGSAHEDFSKTAGVVDGDINIKHCQKRRITVSINTYMLNGDALLARLDQAKFTIDGRNPLFLVGASHVETSDIRDLVYKVDTDFQPRYQADFVLDYRSVLVETNKRVDYLSVEGTIENESITIIGWDNLPPEED